MTAAGSPDGTAVQVVPHVDLHMHSTASDGLLQPSEVVRAAAGLHLSAVALTDHDTISGVAEADAAGRDIGVEVIPGVELSAVERGVETHVLGLHLTRLDWIGARLEEMRQMRRARAEQIVARLNRLGFPLQLEDVLAQSDGGAIGRPHIARALVARGHVADLREAFDRLLGNGRPAFVQKDALALAEAVSIIHSSGGLAFLAHPGRGASRERFERWGAAGADGVEVLHPSHSDEDIGRIARLTSELGLLPSGGSDWHGQPDGYRRLGMMNVPIDWLERQKSAAERLRAQRVA